MKRNTIKKKEEKLNETICSLQKIKSIQEINYLKPELDNIQKRLQDDIFRIAVVGEFSSGKSTFINAIIGKDILSHAVDETTAAITRIHNVSFDDVKNGTCEIHYTDGTDKELSDYTMLKEYTTVQSKIDVADIIREVDIYVNFLNVNHAVEIVDTPGLNGVADKHREITLEEIKRAHTCIYLLSVKGITKSDINFLEFLLDYQSHFIFIQNFIDALKITEGETKEKKIYTAEQIIKDLFKDKGNITYHICAISALFALASKDKSITQVYAGDTDNLTEEEREELYKKSGYEEFENFLADYINSGAYKETIIQTSEHTLETLVISLLHMLKNQQKEKEELMKIDSKNKMVEKAKKRFEEIEDHFNNNKKKLENYIISMDKENRESLKKETKSRLQGIKGELEERINCELKEYYDLERISGLCGGNIGEYFSNIVINKINNDLIKWMDNCMETNFKVIYSDTLLRAEQYTGIHISKSEEGTRNFYLQNDNFSGDIKLQDKRKETKMMEIKKKNMEEDKKREEDFFKENSNKVIKIKNDLVYINNDYNNKKSALNARKKALGPKPDAEEIQIRKEQVVKRTGLFHGIRDFFYEPKIEIYYETKLDYSKVREWERKHAQINAEERQREQEFNDKKEKLENKIKKLEDNNKLSDKKIKEYTERINELKEDIKAKKALYDMMEKNAKLELLNSQKKYIKEQIKKWLLGDDEQSILVKQNKRIEKASLDNIPDIKNDVIREFSRSVEKNKSILKDVIENGVSQLKEQYHASVEDIKKLENILEQI